MAEGGRGHNSGVADVMPSSSPGTSGYAALAEGENVNVQFTKSSVTVVGGDHIQVVYNMIGVESKASHPRQGDKQRRNKDWWKSIRRNVSNFFKRSSASSSSDQDGIISRNLIRITNENTMKLTAVDILEDFRFEKLQQPDFEAFPQMQEIDVEDYYKGRYNNSSTQRSQKLGVHNQLTKEVGFFCQEEIKAKTIGIDNVMTSIWQRENGSSLETVGVTAIVASAGSGKSTLTRRIARQALGISTGDDVKYPPSYDKKMVLYIELKDIEEVRELKPSQFLFGGMYQSEEEEDHAFKWLYNHQSDAILIFDGLDQASWRFYEKSLRNIGNHEKASSWTVMYNILSRNILRHVKVYIASREFKVSELPAMARPETIIKLNGLTLEDAHRLFVFLLKENGEEIWQKIEFMSPRLLNLISVPVFLILTAIVMGRGPSKPPPKTLTELYKRIVLALQSVKNIRNRKQILSIVHKLKKMAFQGMKKERVVFKETDLIQFGVSAEEIQDLMTKVPGNNLLSRHLMQGDFIFFFCHQSLQEYLAAIFITEMKFNEFSHFDLEHLHEERWSVVRSFVAGIVFSKSENDLYEVPDQTKKQDALARSIRSQLDKYNNGFADVRMEIYTAIYESDDDILMKHHSVINASKISLSRVEANIIGSLAARNETLDSLNLTHCKINGELLGIIAKCMDNRIHVQVVDLRGNEISAAELRSLLGHHRIESLSGKLDWKVAKLNIGRWPVVLENKTDVIKISGEYVEGHFNIKDSTLSFHGIDTVALVGFFWILFDAIKYFEQRQLLADLNDLRNTSQCKLENIRKILVDCTKEEKIDWDLIETSWKKYQMEVLDTAVNGQIPVDEYNEILEHGRAISGFVNIHAIFKVAKEDDFRNTLKACQQKKIEYIRCIFNHGCRASLHEISSLLDNAHLKKVSLIYFWKTDILKGSELQKAQTIANVLNTGLEVLELERERDAWQQLDIEFWARS